MVSVEVSIGGDDLDDVEASNERGAQDGSVHRALGSLAFGEALLRGGLLSLCGGWVCVACVACLPFSNIGISSLPFPTGSLLGAGAEYLPSSLT